MSYTASLVAEMERQFGIPDELSHTQRVDDSEFQMIRRSMKTDRTHDITLFIYNDASKRKKDSGFIFIAKHSYPAGLFRAPSGGIHRDEDFIAGAKREAFEETGVDVELEKYLLRIKVRFYAGDDAFDWTSHVFKARYVGGEIKPHDTREIREARVVTLAEIPRFQETMRKSKVGGFHYRAFLTDEVMKRW